MCRTGQRCHVQHFLCPECTVPPLKLGMSKHDVGFGRQMAGSLLSPPQITVWDSLTSPEASYGFSDPPNVGQARFKRQHMPLGRPSSVLPGAWTNPIQTRQLQRSICKVPRLQISAVPGPFAWLESVDGRMAKKIKNLPNVCPVRINFKHFSWEGAVGSKLTASKCHAA